MSSVNIQIEWYHLLLISVLVAPGIAAALLFGVLTALFPVLYRGRWRGEAVFIFLLHLFLFDAVVTGVLINLKSDWYFDAGPVLWPLVRLLVEMTISAVVVRLLKLSGRPE